MVRRRMNSREISLPSHISDCYCRHFQFFFLYLTRLSSRRHAGARCRFQKNTAVSLLATVGHSLMSPPTYGPMVCGTRSFLALTHPSTNRGRRCSTAVNEPLSYSIRRHCRTHTSLLRTQCTLIF